MAPAAVLTETGGWALAAVAATSREARADVVTRSGRMARVGPSAFPPMTGAVVDHGLPAVGSPRRSRLPPTRGRLRAIWAAGAWRSAPAPCLQAATPAMGSDAAMRTPRTVAASVTP